MTHKSQTNHHTNQPHPLDPYASALDRLAAAERASTPPHLADRIANQTKPNRQAAPSAPYAVPLAVLSAAAAITLTTILTLSANNSTTQPTTTLSAAELEQAILDDLDLPATPTDAALELAASTPSYWTSETLSPTLALAATELSELEQTIAALTNIESAL